GCVRTANEDSHVVREDVGIWVVADGMGGHTNGKWASYTVTQAIEETALDNDFNANIDRLEAALMRANRTIYDAAEEAGARMGSTAALLYIDGWRYALLWAGDSRVYLLRDNVLSQVTHDHTQVQEMVDRAAMTKEEARNHPMSHVITRAVGVDEDFGPEVRTEELKPGDIFLLCSDGLTGMVKDEEIGEHLAGMGARAACKALLELALDRGAPDNVTVITVACEEMTALILPQEA
ncbi:MAG TPA: protein phosphatase 2C domain-containing protein, partial [Caulobacteraceae bacterium]|nr:protein phosphatase 2C domain-containing protein [Caulobacteraceae bacterium]